MLLLWLCSCVCRMETHFSYLPLSSVTDTQPLTMAGKLHTHTCANSAHTSHLWPDHEEEMEVRCRWTYPWADPIIYGCFLQWTERLIGNNRRIFSVLAISLHFFSSNLKPPTKTVRSDGTGICNGYFKGDIFAHTEQTCLLSFSGSRLHSWRLE